MAGPLGVLASVGAIAWPVASPRVTPHGAYRFDRSTYRPDGRTHLGLDLAGPRGTAVFAPEAGEVVARWTRAPINRSDYRADARPWNGYGPAGVMLRGVSGHYHVLAHLLASDLVELGPIASGARVGSMSGLNHVHWEVRTVAQPRRGESHADIVIDPRSIITDPGAMPPPAPRASGPVAAPRRAGGALALVLAVIAAAVIGSRS